MEGGYIPSSIFDELEANVTMASTTMAPVERVVERVVALVVNTTTPLINTTTVSTITAPAAVAGAQNITEVAYLAHNIAGVNSTVVKDVVKKAAAMVLNITAPMTTTPPTTTSRLFTPVATTTTPDWVTTTSPALLWTTTPTTIQRAVERVTLRPVVPVEYVSIFSLNDFLECDRCNRTQKVELII